MKSKSFIHNTVILFFAMLLTKLIGAVLKIPLTNILGGEGIGYFSTAYSLFAPVLAFTSSGLPAVITKGVAENSACGRGADNTALKRVALRTAAAVGLLGSALMLVIALPFTLYIANSPNSLLSVVIISPSVFFCCIASVYRGYFEGMMNMTPTALSQVVEAAVKASLGIAFAYLVFTRCSDYFGGESGVLPYAAAAAIFGVTISEITGTAVLAVYSLCAHRKTPRMRGTGTRKISARALLRDALPVSLTAVAANMSGFIDLVTVPNCINLSFANNLDKYIQNPAFGRILSQGTADLGNFVYGCYTGIVTTLFALTSVFTVLIARSVLPRVSAAWAVKNMRELERNFLIMTKYTLWLGLPVNLCFGALAKQALHLLYPARQAEAAVCVVPLQLLCSLGIFISLAGILFAVFQALGMSDIPLKIMLSGTAVKFILNVTLLPLPQLNISGAAVSTCAANIFMSVCGYYLLKKKTGTKIRFWQCALKPLASTAVAVAAITASGSFFPADSAAGLICAAAVGMLVLAVLFLICDYSELRKIFQKYLSKRY